MTEREQELAAIVTGIRISQMEQMQSYQVKASVFLVFLLLVSLVIGVVASIKIARNIVPPIHFLSVIATRFSTGNVTIDDKDKESLDVVRQRTDELGEMGSAFHDLIDHFYAKTMVAAQIAEGDLQVAAKSACKEDVMGMAFEQIVNRLSALLNNVKTSAQNVKTDTEHINAANRNLSKLTEDQAGSLHTLLGTVGMISTKTAENAKSANEADKIALRASELANESKVEMQAMVEAMEGIDASSRGATWSGLSVISLTKQNSLL